MVQRGKQFEIKIDNNRTQRQELGASIVGEKPKDVKKGRLQGRIRGIL
jgi:hypothetical protein